jgi:hypothetical protein
MLSAWLKVELTDLQYQIDYSYNVNAKARG